MSVLILNAGLKNALAAVRSLGRRKIQIGTADTTQWSGSFFSKYCHDYFLYSSPRSNAGKFVGQICEIVKSLKTEMVFPIGVDTTIPLSYYKKD